MLDGRPSFLRPCYISFPPPPHNCALAKSPSPIVLHEQLLCLQSVFTVYWRHEQIVLSQQLQSSASFGFHSLGCISNHNKGLLHQSNVLFFNLPAYFVWTTKVFESSCKSLYLRHCFVDPSVRPLKLCSFIFLASSSSTNFATYPSVHDYGGKGKATFTFWMSSNIYCASAP